MPSTLRAPEEGSCRAPATFEARAPHGLRVSGSAVDLLEPAPGLAIGGVAPDRLAVAQRRAVGVAPHEEDVAAEDRHPRGVRVIRLVEREERQRIVVLPHPG